MEKIKVNMTPTGFTPTIHASQDDNSTRKWGFELYDEDGKIDSSSIKEQMIFDSRVGGTEQILPENTADPTTSPIIADIQYPDSLRSEQTFLYRESPTQEDGQAKIKRIQGNTVVFNQLVQNGNFAENSGWEAPPAIASLSISNNEVTLTLVTVPTAWYQFRLLKTTSQRFDIIQGHKYYVKGQLYPKYSNRFSFSLAANSQYYIENLTPNAWNKIDNTFIASTNSSDVWWIIDAQTNYQIGDTIKYRNLQVFDMTAMGKESYTAEQFEAWLNTFYPLPYYDYTTGKLLPFKGTELKTVGFNQWDEQYETTTRYGMTSLWTKNYVQTLPNTAYCIYLASSIYSIKICQFDADKNLIEQRDRSLNNHMVVFTTYSNCAYMLVGFNPNYGAEYKHDICINISNPSLNGTYKPYETNTLSLPILDYFPTGMKSAGDVYDEKTESKATTRIGSVDLGSLDYVYRTTGSVFAPYFYASFTGIKSNGDPSTNIANILCSKYSTTRRSQSLFIDKTICADGTSTEITQIQIKDSSYTDVTTFKQAMADQNVKLYYELVTPTEESITTASLVTEKGETPLYYDDGLIADCNETISSENGMFDAKIKLMDDNTIYSQKIQLHVERKP